ncbi:chromosomal replication initiator protein DnaA [Thiohalocapsa sp. ML1]|jgi:chromosomal replication initiator protein|uniref:chromosomal replication initiator protein DnaA n=1 Tax=Thiohalocapsa sp. ML1 TaxID=1431688 RepID=UPI00073212EC|nr:chromosomal replication initiator protein DnaA [Thiohalocapsa sp. ML1]
MSDLWAACAAALKEDLTAAEYSTWIMPLQAQDADGAICLLAPNRFVKDWVKQHYEQRIVRLCNEISGGRVRQVRFEIGALVASGSSGAGPENPRVHISAEAVLERRRAESNLNKDFTFSTFVEGKSNQIARAASIQIGQNPGTAYNPLFIYGGVGLGKTHLMHAVGNTILDTNPNAKVIYVHSERFVSDMIRALQHNKIDEFKGRYRRVNALLIDDVQFFGNKDRSQEEFFHTFNALFESKQQIVLSSDRYPKEVTGLEERLKSRFGWGLTVGIEPPDFETRVAILQSKAALLNVELPEDVGYFVAKRMTSNIRELEGALRRLVANSHFMGAQIDMGFTRDVLRDMFVAQDRQITIENIQKTVANYYKLRVSDLTSAKRTRNIARPRQVAMALAKELTKASLPEIGNAFGGRDHSTVIHATRKIEALRASDTMIEEDYRILLRTLTS